jgi:hypothetical protein
MNQREMAARAVWDIVQIVEDPPKTRRTARPRNGIKDFVLRMFMRRLGYTEEDIGWAVTFHLSKGRLVRDGDRIKSA